MRRPRGVTLIEIMMAVLIGSILSLALTRLFSSGLRMTQKGSSHLTNMQGAAIFLAQIEHDLERIEKIEALESSPGESKIVLSRKTSDGMYRISYQPLPGGSGYQRTQENHDGTNRQSHTFGLGAVLQMTIKSVSIKGKTGIFCEVKAKTQSSGGEEAILKRFFFPQSLEDNRLKGTRAWIY